MFKITGDIWIRRWVMFIMVASFLIVASASTAVGISNTSSSTFYFFKHTIYLLATWLIVAALSRAKAGFYNILFSTADLILAGSFLLLLLTVVFGKTINGANRWLSILPGITIQTSDVFKLAIITYAAKYLAIAKDDQQKLERNGMKILIALGGGLFFIIKHDLSTAILISSVVIFMFLISGMSKELLHKFLLYIVVAGALAMAVLFVTKLGSRTGTWQSRIENFIHGDKVGQATIAKAAIAKGGLVRFAPGQSEFKNMLPQASSDFIFSVIGEEYGALGAIFIIGLYLFFGWRSLYILRRVKRAFAAYLLAGYSMAILLQAIIHILVNVGLLPVTGQPLPFISTGGSFLLIAGFMLGIILNISKMISEELPQEQRENLSEDPLISPHLMD